MTHETATALLNLTAACRLRTEALAAMNDAIHRIGNDPTPYGRRDVRVDDMVAAGQEAELQVINIRNCALALLKLTDPTALKVP